MAENSAIEWTDHTFNPWIGCTHVSPACDHCYAEALSKARLGVPWGPHAERRRTKFSTWAAPKAWDRRAARAGRRERVFCASLADVWDNQVPPEWRADLFSLIRATPNLDWLLLSKRIGNAAVMIEAAGGLPANVWLGATVVTQAEADRDVLKLLATPAAKRFLSMEPLLGPVDLTRCRVGTGEGEGSWAGKTIHLNINGLLGAQSIAVPALDWIIVGGESGPGARPMHPDWARSLRDQCAAAEVPFLFKQWGEWREPEPGEAFDTTIGRAGQPPAFIVRPSDGTVHCFLPEEPDPRLRVMIKAGKKHTGRLLDGVEHNGVPA